MGRTVGIDLGTTNSVVSYVLQDRIESIPNQEGSKITPSVVLFGEDEILVGELAKRQLVTNPGFVVRSAKRLMGRRFSEVQEVLEDFPFEVVEGKDDRAEIRLVDGRIIPPEVVSAQVLRKMVETAEDFLGEAVEAAVITVPAYFNDAQRTATKSAADLANLNVLRIINEPTAAALAFGYHQSSDRPRKIAVFDFGGGTFDVSILQLQGDIFEVLSTNGDTQLGGDNIDLRLFHEICDRILQETGIDPTQDMQAVARIRETAEKTKIELSSLATTHISLPFIVSDSSGPKHFECDITREEFNHWMAPIFDRLFIPCANALSDAHLQPSDLDDVVLVGGSTRIPRVQEMVAQFFGREGNRSINPDEAISIGAGIQAGVMRGDLQEVLLLDVTPLSLGIELAGGLFKPLIERNSSIPCEATRKFTTVVDNQVAVTVHVLQGERARASENRSLARFRLTGLPPMPKELAEIEVTFRIDVNGILEVSAVDLTSGVSTGIQIEGYGEFAPLSEEEKKRLMADVEAHSRDDEDFVRTASRRAQAERIQERINRIFDDAPDAFSEADIKKMKETLLRHDLALLAKDWMQVELHEQVLNDLADRYEGAAEMHRALNRHVNLEMSSDEDEASASEISRVSLRGGKDGAAPSAFEAMAEPLEDEEIIFERASAEPAEAPKPTFRQPAAAAPVALNTPPPPAPAPPSKSPITVKDGRVLAAEDDFDPALAPPPPPKPR